MLAAEWCDCHGQVPEFLKALLFDKEIFSLRLQVDVASYRFEVVYSEIRCYKNLFLMRENEIITKRKEIRK